jgi:hypothetical protein
VPRSYPNAHPPYWDNPYGYGAWGNLTNKTITKCGAENLGVAALANNQLSGYSYDAAGNMANDGLGHAFTYDGEGRISQINSGAVQYTYDPEMGRVRKDITGQPSTESTNGKSFCGLSSLTDAKLFYSRYQSRACGLPAHTWFPV